MMHRSPFPRDMSAELERLQQEMLQAMDLRPGIRGLAGGYPAVNVGSTATGLEIYVFAPGMDPAGLEVQIEQGLLTVSGERKEEDIPADTAVHMDERFAGRFRRVISLPDDLEAEAVSARYRDGVLHISVPRRESSKPRRITVQ